MTTTRLPPHEDLAPGGVRHHRSALRKALAGLLACLLLLAAGVFLAARSLEHRLSRQVQWIPHAFSGLPDRPFRPTAGPAAQALNILLIGSDRRSAAPTTGSRATRATWAPGEQRSDTLMILHVSADRHHLGIVSIPRDSWVDVPGHGQQKINAAFSLGGPTLAVATVEHLTGIRIDHVAVVDWDGFERLADLEGGVDVDIPQTVYDSARNHLWTAGWHHLDGRTALLYVRQRHGLPGGDLDRVRRQQNVLRALLDKLHRHRPGPVTTYRLVDAFTENLSTDTSWSFGQMAHLALQLRGTSRRDAAFATVPVRGTGMVGGQSVVFLDRAADRMLWHAVAADRLVDWLSRHPSAQLGASDSVR